MAGHPALPSLSAGTLKHRSEGHPSEVPPPHPKLAKAAGSGGGESSGRVQRGLDGTSAGAVAAGVQVGAGAEGGDSAFPGRTAGLAGGVMGAAGVATRLRPLCPSGPHTRTTCPGWRWRVTQATGQTQAQSPTGPPVAGQTPGHRLSRRPSSCTADRPAPGEGLSSLSHGTSSRLAPPPGRCCEGPSPGGSSSLNPAQTKEPPLGAELPRRLLHKAALWSPGTNASVLGSGFLWQFLSANVVGAPRVWGQGWGPPGSLPSGASLRWPSESLEAAPSSRKGDGCPRDVLASPRGPALPARARGMLSARRPCTPGLSGPPFLPGCNPESFLLFPGSCPTHPVTSTQCPASAARGAADPVRLVSQHS